MRTLSIGDRLIGEGEPAFIIAEAGINHQGDEQIALRLIEVAAAAGADAVKFQKRTVSRILTRAGLEMPYVNPNSFGPTYGEHKRALEFDLDTFRRLQRRAHELGLIFLASAWDEESVDQLEAINVPAHKAASAEVTNTPLLEHMARTGKPLLLSTGMSTLEEVDRAVASVRRHHDQLVLLQCTSTYPSDFEAINLRVINLYRQRYGLLVGYSGHERGIALGPVAVALGACVVERHFTLDRTMKGSDHAASLEPAGLEKLVRDIRATEQALGDGVKRMIEGEWPVRRKLAKSVVSAVDLPAGTILARHHLTTKGPGIGLPASDIERLLGGRVTRDVPADTVLQTGDVALDAS